MISTIFNMRLRSTAIAAGFLGVLPFLATSTLADVMLIGEVQGAGHWSPFEGEIVSVEGTITSVDHQRNAVQFTIQGEADGDPATSDAIVVRYRAAAPLVDANGRELQVGNIIRATGPVQEFQRRPRDRTVISCGTINLTTESGGVSRQLPLTQLSVAAGSMGLEYLGEGERPEPLPIETPTRQLPDQYDDDGLQSFDVSTDYIDYFESLESMLVSVGPSVATGPINRFEEIWVQPETTSNVQLVDSWRLMVTHYAQQANRILLSLPQPNTEAGPFEINAGAEFPEVTGIASYSFGAYKIILTDIPETVSTDVGPSEPFERISADSFVVATYNTNNFAVAAGGASGSERLNAFADQIANALGQPDLVVLQEVQDDDGGQISTTTSGQMNGDALAAGIEHVGGPTYTYAEAEPELNCDGGQPGANIRSAFLYDASKLTLLQDVEQMPGSREPGGPFENSRKPTTALFERPDGYELLVVAVHFASKRTDDPLQGTVPNPGRPTDSARLEQAEAVMAFIEQQMSDHPERLIIVAGDFNDFYFSPVLQRMVGAGASALSNVIDGLPEEDRWTYIFDGRAQALDHILVGGATISSTRAGVIRLNSWRASQFSDHDPLVAELQID